MDSALKDHEIKRRSHLVITKMRRRLSTAGSAVSGRSRVHDPVLVVHLDNLRLVAG